MAAEKLRTRFEDHQIRAGFLPVDGLLVAMPVEPLRLKHHERVEI